MQLKNMFLLLLTNFLLTTYIHAQTPKDYLHVPGPLSFDKVDYQLAWSSHPSEVYYKHEYLAAGDTLEHFKKLLMLEVVVSNIPLKNAVSQKVAELKALKKTNPVVNYTQTEKNGEFILDFTISENSANGKQINILERNVYRYKSFKTKSGQDCILLFAISERTYGKEAGKYLANLKKNRAELVNKVSDFTIPEISISK